MSRISFGKGKSIGKFDYLPMRMGLIVLPLYIVRKEEATIWNYMKQYENIILKHFVFVITIYTWLFYNPFF